MCDISTSRPKQKRALPRLVPTRKCAAEQCCCAKSTTGSTAVATLGLREPACDRVWRTATYSTGNTHAYTHIHTHMEQAKLVSSTMKCEKSANEIDGQSTVGLRETFRAIVQKCFVKTCRPPSAEKHSPTAKTPTLPIKNHHSYRRVLHVNRDLHIAVKITTFHYYLFNLRTRAGDV